MSLFDKYQLKEELKNGIYTIVFEKLDGTIREMRCTLQPEYLPPQLLNEGEEKKEARDIPGVLSVWDLENGGWRSMHVAMIQTVVKE